MVNNIFLGLGSNEGERINFLRNAVAKINRDPSCSIEKISSIYETKPYGIKDQDNFYNVVVKISSSYSLHQLFQRMKTIEKDIGRQRTYRWGPREIDIDILFFNNVIYSDETLTVPHRDIVNREFVMKPLTEIDPDFVHPVFKKRIFEFDKLKEKLIVNKYGADLLITEEE